MLFVLQVLGCAGAVWGCSEIVGLRRDGSEDETFQWICLGVLSMAMVWHFVVHVLDMHAHALVAKEWMGERVDGLHRLSLASRHPYSVLFVLLCGKAQHDSDSFERERLVLQQDEE